jgi:hypothetical protein
MKIWLACGIVAAAFAFASVAPAAPERGSGNAPGSRTSEPFYQGKEGSWVLMRKPVNDGYSCSVNFITPTNGFTIVGPVDAETARNGRGTIWFTGKSVSGSEQASSVRIAVSGNNPYPSVPAQQISLPGKGGALIVAIDLRLTLKDKQDSNDIGVHLQGREVFRSKVIRLQEAYRKLEQCMNGSEKTTVASIDKPPTTPQNQLEMKDDELAIYYDILPDDPQRALKIAGARQMIRNYLVQSKTLKPPPARAPSDNVGRPSQNQGQRMCAYNNGQVGYLAPC